MGNGEMNKAKRIVVKVGSNTLATATGSLDHRYIASLVDQLSELSALGCEVVLVTSGAVAAGREVLGLMQRPEDTATLQAAASIGQVALVETYASEFGRRRLTIGQVLLTRADLENETSYGHARDTFERLLGLGAVPVVNENDTVAVEELCFGDNDSLAAQVAAMIGADMVVFLTDVQGLYDDNPHLNSEACLIEQLNAVDDEMIEGVRSGAGNSTLGSGGMKSKLVAARALLESGIMTVLCDGREANVVVDAVKGTPHGTVIRAH
jgi:glutamate 5-kinase